MKIKSIKVKNFRSLKEVNVEFEEGLTCIVGENDSGKTSLLACLKVFSENDPYQVRVDDFHISGTETENSIEIELELSDRVKLRKVFKLVDGHIEGESKIYLPKAILTKELDAIKEKLSEYDKQKQIKDLEQTLRTSLEHITQRILGNKPRSNKKVDNIINELETKLSSIGSEHEVNTDYRIHIYYLDNRTIQEPELIIEKLFFEDIKKEVWTAEISDDKTIKEVVEEKILELKTAKEREFRRDLEEKIKDFLHQEVKLAIDFSFSESPLNIRFKTKFVDEYNNEISFENKGEGTKRRVTMALVEFKMKEEQKNRDVNVFIFDEPDTHLHVKAQRELLGLLSEHFENKQIIITTHSPYILNLLKPHQIRVCELTKSENNTIHTKIKSLNINEVESLLRDLGIENLLLFFSRKILIVEGKTEKVFLDTLYEYYYKTPPYGDFLKIIEGQGTTDVVRVVKVLLNHLEYKPEQVFLMVDKDIENRSSNDPLHKILDWLKSNGWNEETQLFKVGNKEFEDCFEPEHIYKAWKNYVEKKGKKVSVNWTLENIKQVYQECVERGAKLREKLQELNDGSGVPFRYADSFPKALAEYFSEYYEYLPSEIKSLLNTLKEEQL